MIAPEVVGLARIVGLEDELARIAMSMTVTLATARLSALLES
jgi:hypothetical protein